MAAWDEVSGDWVDIDFYGVTGRVSKADLVKFIKGSDGLGSLNNGEEEIRVIKSALMFLINPPKPPPPPPPGFASSQKIAPPIAVTDQNAPLIPLKPTSTLAGSPAETAYAQAMQEPFWYAAGGIVLAPFATPTVLIVGGVGVGGGTGLHEWANWSLQHQGHPLALSPTAAAWVHAVGTNLQALGFGAFLVPPFRLLASIWTPLAVGAGVGLATNGAIQTVEQLQSTGWNPTGPQALEILGPWASSALGFNLACGGGGPKPPKVDQTVWEPWQQRFDRLTKTDDGVIKMSEPGKANGTPKPEEPNGTANRPEPAPVNEPPGTGEFEPLPPGQLVEHQPPPSDPVRPPDPLFSDPDPLGMELLEQRIDEAANLQRRIENAERQQRENEAADFGVMGNIECVWGKRLQAVLTEIAQILHILSHP